MILGDIHQLKHLSQWVHTCMTLGRLWVGSNQLGSARDRDSDGLKLET